jgi:hypothetical protein
MEVGKYGRGLQPQSCQALHRRGHFRPLRQTAETPGIKRILDRLKEQADGLSQKVSAADRRFVSSRSLGPSAMIVSGGVRSTVKWRVAALDSAL